MASPANTPSVYYLDNAEAAKHCEKDRKEVERKCAPHANDHKHRGKGRPKARAADKDKSKNDADWVLDHCGPLLVQPGPKGFEEWYATFKDIDGALKEVASQLKDSVITKLEREMLEYAGEKALKLAARRGLTGWIPIVGWAISAVDVVVTAVEVGGKVIDIKETISDLKDTVKRLQDASDKVRRTLGQHGDKLKNFDKLSADEKKKISYQVMADVQTAYGTANPCLRARKCMLVPFNKKSADKWAGKGCCPGQTGHHLMPDAMFRDAEAGEAAKAAWKADRANYNKDGKLKTMGRDKLPKKACWDGYSEGGSPTICVEGNNQHLGSHGVLHGLTHEQLNLGRFLNKPEMPYTDARDLVLDEVSKTYGCNKRCLQEQLDDYYCNKAASKKPGCPDCKNAKVTPNSGMGNGADEDADLGAAD